MVRFEDCQTEATFEVKLNTSPLVGIDGIYDERSPPRSFMIDVHSSYPKHAYISRRHYCRVDVGPDPKDWDKVD